MWLSQFVLVVNITAQVPRVKGGAEGAKKKLAVQEAEVSRLEIDDDFNVPRLLRFFGTV